MSALSTTWVVLVPVKQTTDAKTRLTGMSAVDRAALALAFACDTVAAARTAAAVERVVVVTNDPAASVFRSLGAEVLPDRPDAGLNPALVDAAHVVRDRDPHAAVAALSADLPALDAESLDVAFGCVDAPYWFVSDAVGVGTTLLAADRGHRLDPAFGPHSRAAHRSRGAVEAQCPGLARLRRDVDTPVDLWDAVRLGVGPHTRQALTARNGRIA